ncbi:hypothetical protein [Pseudomonas phage LKD16]|uniref:Uncharacterized protein n=1 Tax=Pseudomonas phage LKD16 TaxID=386792 RepID=Q0E647_9CAUD|nr:hypothetical protein PPLKD16_gp17b [Pseudomonas phage LKD16]CAK25952.1 hypothetical protein [Pseudomonas phage LKD16]
MRLARTDRRFFTGDDMVYHAIARPAKKWSLPTVGELGRTFGGCVFRRPYGYLAHCQGESVLCPSLGAARRRLHRMMRQEAKRRASTN